VVANPDVLTQEIRIDAQPETVFSYFTDPARMVRWKGRAATLDPRPGGVYRVEVSDENVVVGEYVEVTPYSRVVFTWGWENGQLPPGASTVEIDLEPVEGATLLRLTHRDLSTPESVASHAEGWTHYLPRLAELAAGGDPGPDPWGAGTS
jgi:uncharacterized protein YndB with AHSA1/START domain